MSRETFKPGDVVRISKGTAIYRGGPWAKQQFGSRVERTVEVLATEEISPHHLGRIYWMERGELRWTKEMWRVELLSSVELLARTGRR